MYCSASGIAEGTSHTVPELQSLKEKKQKKKELFSSIL